MAQGICQLCDKEAPFLDKQGNPFLEVHHINYLSNGGEDKIDNVVALCPNCHRRIHMLEDEEDFKKILKKTSLI
ncbi:HNH endonuclease [Priestia megaterium]|nr:HNH endonuclease [Priestia megaterium]